MNGCQATFLNEEIRKLPAGHPLRQHPTTADSSNEIQENFVICYFSKNRLVSKLSCIFHILPLNSTSSCFGSLYDFKQNVLVLFLHLFIGQRSLNNTLEDIERVHADGITFMEAEKRLFPDRNGSQNPDGSMMGWSEWKFHSIVHKAMELLLYGWPENVSTQSGESAHKVLFHLYPHNSTYVFHSST